MDLSDFISPEEVLPHLRATCKKGALQELARAAAEAAELDERKVFDVLLERERLGTTGVGEGIAIPHGRLPEIDGVYGLFARLDEPIDYDSVDDQPVDLIFLLLAPEDAGADHLKALSRVSRLLRDKGVRQKLRESDSRDGLYALLTDAETSRAA